MACNGRSSCGTWRGTAADRAVPRSVAAGVTPTNLPAYTDSFVGRASELAELDALVDVERLVTIVGPGGGGKTRLAHRLGVQRTDRHPDGVWWLDLVTVSDPVLLAASLSQVIGLPDDRVDPIQSLTGRLGARRCLVILDNCEHMIPEVADLAFAIVAACPNVHLVATSRASLTVAGEVVWTIPPLALPDDAVELFVERARRVRQNFRISPTNESLIAAICTRLDGIPLPIELAAARCKVLTPQQILDGLENAIGLLTGGARGTLQRHQTIEASIAWSHGLLRPDEQLLLRRLSIFESPFSLDAVEAVCSDDQLARPGVLDLLERLVDQSLVQVVDEPDDRPLPTARDRPAVRSPRARHEWRRPGTHRASYGMVRRAGRELLAAVRPDDGRPARSRRTRAQRHLCCTRQADGRPRASCPGSAGRAPGAGRAPCRRGR